MLVGPSRHPRSVVLPLLLGAVLLPTLGLGAANARPLQISVAPEAPTWRDPLTITVAGTVVTSCGPEIVHLTADWTGLNLTEDDCPLLGPPTAYPFVRSVTIGRLPPLSQFSVYDRTDNTVHSVPLAISEVGRVELLLPTAARSDQPVSLGVRLWGSLNCLEDLQVSGRVITLTALSLCGDVTIPPGPYVDEEYQQVGPLAPGDYEVRILDGAIGPQRPLVPSLVKGTFRVWDAAGCVPGDTALCLQEGRFRVTASWRDFADRTGVGHATRLSGNEGSGLLWFFGADNTELTVKVLNGCDVGGHWWVFLASSSTVEYTLTVTDTANGATRTYRNELGQLPQLIADTSAFECP